MASDTSVHWLCVQFITFVVVIQLKANEAWSITFPDDNSSGESAKAPEPVLKLCPAKHWLFNDTKTCHPSGVKGPCPATMKFYPIDKKTGDCECEREAEAFLTNSTTLVYDVSSDKCYKSYEQAYCKAGEWLIYDEKDGEPVCVRNKCEGVQNKTAPVVLFNSVCVELGKSSKEANCTSPFEISIDRDTGKPFCTKEFAADRCVTCTTGFKCRAGTKRNRLGRCVPTNSKVKLRP